MIRESSKIFANRLGFVIENWRDLKYVCIVRCDKFVMGRANFGMNRGKVLKHLMELGWTIVEEYNKGYIVLKFVRGKDEVVEQ